MKDEQSDQKRREQWEVIFEMMQVYYHDGDPLENEVLKAQAIANYFAQNIAELEAENRELRTLLNSVKLPSNRPVASESSPYPNIYHDQQP